MPALRRSAPLVVLLALTGGFWTYNTLPFVAEDCYFYPIIARNLALRGVQSFWGVELTNGVHPLWTLLLGGYTWVVSRVSIAVLHNSAYGLPLVLALLGLGAMNFIEVADRARLPRSVVVFPLVVYLSVFGMVYSEAHTAFFAHSCLARLACRDDEGESHPVAVGLAASAVFLARLDSVFYVGAFMVWYAVRDRSLSTVAKMACACAVPACLYVAVNLLYFGGAAPISGYLKSTFPMPFIQGLRFVGGPAVMLSGYSLPFGWLPLGFGVVTALLLRRRLEGFQTLLYPLIVGTAGHAVYTGFFTAGFTDWYWYYVLPILLASWSAACLLRSFRFYPWDERAQWAAVILLAAGLFESRLHRPDDQELPALKTLRVSRELGIEHSVVLMSEWPGTLGFYSSNDVIAADMLTSNRQLVQRMVENSNALDVLFDEARRQGFPVRYVIYNGGMFVKPARDLSGIDLMDPKMVNNLRGVVIGHAELGTPLAVRDGIVVWKIAGS